MKGTRLLQVLEPHFNQAKIDQVTGRGARYRSHADLPEKDRTLLIENYQSEFPKHWYNKWGLAKVLTAIDRYLQDASDRKQALIDGV